MVFRLTLIKRITLLLASVIFAVGLSYYSVRAAIAEHYVEQATIESLRKATNLEPGDAKIWYLFGRQLHLSLNAPDANGAISALKKSLSLTASADAWLELASLYEDGGAVDEARAAFIHAKEFYPASAEVAWQFGNFLLRSGDILSARGEIYRAVSGDPKLGFPAFLVLHRFDSDVKVIDRDLPPIPSVLLDILWGTYESAPSDVTLTLWRRLYQLGHSGSAVPEGHFQYTQKTLFGVIEKLIQKGPQQDVTEVWKEVQVYLGTKSTDQTESVVWDGGFEGDIQGGGLTWRLNSGPEAEIRFDRREKHSGLRSIRVQFDGKHNVDFHHACQFVAVQPGTRYEISGWIKSEEITTDSGVFIRVTARPNWSAAAATPQVTGTMPWTRLITDWRAPKDAYVAEVCLVRLPSQKLYSQIGGTVWLDDVAISPVFDGR